MTVLVLGTVVLALIAGMSTCGRPKTPAALTKAARIDTTSEERTASFGIFVQADGEVTWTLSENPSTGYEWSFRLPPGVEQAESVYAAPSPSASPRLGAPGTRTVTLRVPQPGLYMVTAKYARPWESRRPERRYRLTIYANPAGQPAPKAVYAEKNSPVVLATGVGTVVAVVLKQPESGVGMTSEWTITVGEGLSKPYDRLVSPQAPAAAAATGTAAQRIVLIKVDKAGTSRVTGTYSETVGGTTEYPRTFSLTIRAK